MLTIQADVSLLDKISSYNRLKRITAWMLRFIHNCQTRRNDQQPVMRGSLSTTELNAAEMRWLVSAQRLYFPEEISALRDNVQPTRSRLRPFRPFLDLDGLLRVGGRQKTVSTPIPKPASGDIIREEKIYQDVDPGRALEVIARRANVCGSISCSTFSYSWRAESNPCNYA